MVAHVNRFCLKLGWLYTRLVASNSFAPEYRAASDGAEADSEELRLLGTATIPETMLNNSIQEFMAMSVLVFPLQ